MDDKTGTVCFITNGEKVLLALIEYEPGDQKWNGIGGVVDEGESPAQAVVREIAEETQLKVDEQDLKNHGVIDTGKLPLFIFTANKWSGSLQVIDPSLKVLRWFDFDDVPYSEMWPGNDDWLPKVLSGESI